MQAIIKEQEKSIAKALSILSWKDVLTSFPAKKDMITFNCKLFDVSYSNCLAANEAEARIFSSDLLVVAYFHSHRLVSWEWLCLIAAEMGTCG